MHIANMMIWTYTAESLVLRAEARWPASFIESNLLDMVFFDFVSLLISNYLWTRERRKRAWYLQELNPNCPYYFR